MTNSTSHLRRHPHFANVVLIVEILLVALSSRDVCFAEEPEPVGYVFEAKGEWLQNDKRIERKNGELVYAGATITLDPEYRTKNPMRGSIIIVLFSGKREERRPDEPENFNKPIKLDPLGEQTTPWSRIVRAVAGLFVKQPEKYLITAVRGGNLFLLQEAVIKLEDGKIDLSPALSWVRSGTYLASFWLIDGKKTSGSDSSPEPRQIQWKSNQPAPSTISGLRLGLWLVSLRFPRDEFSLGMDAWVLVCSPAQYEEAVDSFKKAVELTRSWGENVDPGEVRSFLRTYLDALDRQATGE